MLIIKNIFIPKLWGQGLKLISLVKLVENEIERDPTKEGSESQKFLKLVLDEDCWGVSEKSWQLLFKNYSKKAQEDFIQEMIDGGWITKVPVNQLDTQIKITSKGEKIFLK